MDAGSATLATDQRGFARPHAPATCDAGAYEYAGTAPAPQAISFPPLPDRHLGPAPFTVAAVGGGSDIPVTVAAGPAAVCAASGADGATIAVVGLGTCTVTASQAGGPGYLAAPRWPAASP